MNSRFYLMLFVLIYSIHSYADENRRIVGGDLLYPGDATSDNQEDALFRAEMQAVKRIEVECLVVHKSIVTYEKSVKLENGRWHAVASVGLPVRDCQAAKETDAVNRKYLVHPALQKSMERYNEVVGISTPKHDPGLIASIKEGFNSLVGSMNKHGKKIDRLNDEVRELQNKPTVQNITIQPTKVVMGTEAAKKLCMEQAESEMHEAESYPKSRYGQMSNFAFNKFEKAERKLSECRGM